MKTQDLRTALSTLKAEALNPVKNLFIIQFESLLTDREQAQLTAQQELELVAGYLRHLTQPDNVPLAAIEDLINQSEDIKIKKFYEYFKQNPYYRSLFITFFYKPFFVEPPLPSPSQLSLYTIAENLMVYFQILNRHAEQLLPQDDQVFTTANIIAVAFNIDNARSIAEALCTLHTGGLLSKDQPALSEKYRKLILRSAGYTYENELEEHPLEMLARTFALIHEIFQSGFDQKDIQYYQQSIHAHLSLSNDLISHYRNNPAALAKEQQQRIVEISYLAQILSLLKKANLFNGANSKADKKNFALVYQYLGKKSESDALFIQNLTTQLRNLQNPLTQDTLEITCNRALISARLRSLWDEAHQYVLSDNYAQFIGPFTEWHKLYSNLLMPLDSEAEDKRKKSVCLDTLLRYAFLHEPCDIKIVRCLLAHGSDPQQALNSAANKNCILFVEEWIMCGARASLALEHLIERRSNGCYGEKGSNEIHLQQIVSEYPAAPKPSSTHSLWTRQEPEPVETPLMTFNQQFSCLKRRLAIIKNNHPFSYNDMEIILKDCQIFKAQFALAATQGSKEEQAKIKILQDDYLASSLEQTFGDLFAAISRAMPEDSAKDDPIFTFNNVKTLLNTELSLQA